jgi:hypothetical protein
MNGDSVPEDAVRGYIHEVEAVRMSFELKAREHTEGGVRLQFRCSKCGTEATIFIKHSDPFEKAYPMSCRCSPEAFIQTGPGLTGKALLKAITNAPEPPEDALKRHSPSPN